LHYLESIEEAMCAVFRMKNTCGLVYLMNLPNARMRVEREDLRKKNGKAMIPPHLYFDPNTFRDRGFIVLPSEDLGLFAPECAFDAVWCSSKEVLTKLEVVNGVR